MITMVLVAMTRPKKHLCVIGDGETVGRYVFILGLAPGYFILANDSAGLDRGNDFLRKWMDFLDSHSDVRYPDPAG